MARITIIKKILIFLVATYYPIFGFSIDNISNVDNLRTNNDTIKVIREQNSKAIIEEAYTWLDVIELTGNNDHPRITEAMNLCGLPGDAGYPWCAASQAKIHYDTGNEAPRSALVVEWFKKHVVWKKQWGDKMVDIKPGMVGALYYRSLGRYGHIVLIVAEDNNNYYTLEGNTNSVGSREGQGFYKKIRSKESISAIADYCLNDKLFNEEYEKILNKFIN